MRWLASLLLLASAGLYAQPPELPDAQQARYHALIAELRCVICQNRSIAESDVALAQDMRDLVAQQMLAGRSNAEIKEYLVARYGEFVLYNPRFGASTWLLWLGPIILLLLAITVGLLVLRRGRIANEAATPDSDKIQRVLEDDAY